MRAAGLVAACVAGVLASVASSALAGLRFESSDALAIERREIESEVTRSLPSLVEFFGDSLAGDYVIELTGTPAEFVNATSGRAPVWAVGVAMPREGRVVLQSERFTPPGTRVGRVAVHEIIHLFVAEAADGGAPRWLDEGIAVYLSGEDRGATIYDLAKALYTENLLFLDEIARRFPESGASARLAYYESLTAVQFIARNWGAASLRDLLDATARYGYEDALRATYGMTSDELEFEWYRDLRKRTRWVGWVGEGVPLAALMTLLVVAAWARKRAVARRRLARWEREEAAADAALARAEGEGMSGAAGAETRAGAAEDTGAEAGADADADAHPHADPDSDLDAATRDPKRKLDRNDDLR
ncbi:MAG: peptidase MA family metallohydrolase [bacterium]